MVKNPPANAGNMGSIPASGKIPWRRKWQPAPVSLPEKFTDRETATVHGVVKSLSRLCTQAVYLIDHQMALVVQKTFVFDCNRILLNGTFFSLPRVILVSTSLNVFLFSQTARK